jgi:hypothetical protein
MLMVGVPSEIPLAVPPGALFACPLTANNAPAPAPAPTATKINHFLRLSCEPPAPVGEFEMLTEGSTPALFWPGIGGFGFRLGLAVWLGETPLLDLFTVVMSVGTTSDIAGESVSGGRVLRATSGFAGGGFGAGTAFSIGTETTLTDRGSGTSCRASLIPVCDEPLAAVTLNSNGPESAPH